jgi:hypothetical protein
MIGSAFLGGVRRACVAVFEIRNEHAWPPRVKPLPHWALIYRQALEGLEGLTLAPDVFSAATVVAAFVRRIDTAC